MPPDHNGVATFRIGKGRWASWPLYAGSRAPSQASRSSLLTLTPVRTHTATHVPFCITTLRPSLHSCSTRHQLFLAEISTVAVYFPCAFTTCLRPRGYPRRPGRMEMGLWCLPSLISPPFRVGHLTYATSCRTSGLCEFHDLMRLCERSIKYLRPFFTLKNATGDIICCDRVDFYTN